MLILVAHRGFFTPLGFGGLHTHCECVISKNSLVPPAGRSQERGIFRPAHWGSNSGKPPTPVNRIELYHVIGLHLGHASLWSEFRSGGSLGVVGEYQPDSFLNASQIA